MYYFSQESSEGTTTITCEVTQRSWSYLDNNAAAKLAAQDAALAHQDKVFDKLRHVLTKHFYTLAEIVSEWSKVA